MAGVNKHIIVGTLGRDPELKQAGNSPVCRMSVATSRKYKNRNGEYEEETVWHRVTVWGKQAEHCANYLAKGRQVYIEGRIKHSKYTDKDGVEKYSTETVADTVQFLGGKGEGQQRKQQGPKSYDGGSYNPGMSDDDIPF